MIHIDAIKAAMAERPAAREDGRCILAPVGCGGEAAVFRDDASRREYAISGWCQLCQDKYWEAECTCDTPCCEVDVGVAYVTCGAQHCPKHATPENQGVPSYRSYAEGSRYSADTVGGQRIGTATHRENRLSD